MILDGVSLRIGPLADRDVTVASFQGEEALSRVYRFDITVHAATDLLAYEPTLLGAPATLAIGTDGLPRVVQGIVTALSGDGTAHRERRKFMIRLSPRMALLKKRRTSRIFQDLSLVDIINHVLDGHAVPRIWNLAGTYRVRTYAVQYQETDYELIARLCAESGIFFYFVPPPSAAVEQGTPPEMLSEQIVFCDSPRHYPSMAAGALGAVAEAGGASAPAPVVPFRPPGDASVAGERVHELAYRRSIQPQSVALRDYDFERPRLDLSARARRASLRRAWRARPARSRSTSTTANTTRPTCRRPMPR
jgi:type VI secretion system secreted protein VgrG